VEACKCYALGAGGREEMGVGALGSGSRAGGCQGAEG